MPYKCQICHKYITHDFFERQAIVKGELRFNKSGTPKMERFHLHCFEDRERNKKEWDCLIKYIERTHFPILVPKTLYMGLRELGNSVKYKLIQFCLEGLEKNLYLNMATKSFKSDSQKSNYILAAVKNNINKVVEDCNKEEECQIIEDFDFILNNKAKEKTKEKEDYDFLE